jgi:ketosteroid isomerase-like protein
MKNAEALLMNHLGSFMSNDVEALMSDYTNDSVLITETATYSGIDEIKNFFVDLIKHFPKLKSNFKLEKLVVSNNLVFIVWQGETPSLKVPFGSDTFILKNGRIHQQTFVGQLKFIEE